MPIVLDQANLLISGHFDLEKGRPIFRVTAVKTLPADLENWRDRKRKLKSAQPAAWYELAGEAMERSEFYDDEELRKLAVSVYREAVQVERRQIADDAAGLEKLAKKAGELGLPKSLQQEIQHETLHLRWKTRQKEKQPKYEPLLKQIVEQLPAARIALQKPETQLQQQYLKEPAAIYQSSDGRTRLKLHRVFYATVRLRQIESTADPEGRNGFAIAAEIDDALPDWHDTAEQWRAREIEYQVQHVEDLSEPGVVQLAARLRKREQSDRAKQAIPRIPARISPVLRL